MKKKYIIPSAKESKIKFNCLLYTTSFEYGGKGGEETEQDTKSRYIEDIEEDNGEGFYRGW